MLDYINVQLSGYIDVAKTLSRDEKMRIDKIISNALNSTNFHIANYGEENYDKSSQILSNIWLNASQMLMKFNNSQLDHFARILKEKSYYWSDPNGFDPANPYAFDMLLTNVKAKLEELIK